MAPITDLPAQAAQAPVNSGCVAAAATVSNFCDYQDDIRFERIVKPLENQDLWAFVERDSESRALFAWRDPRGALDFVATGEILRLDILGPQRFEEAQRWCSEIFEQAGTVASDLPCLVGGFAFSDTPVPEGSCWQMWPDGSFVLPERIAFRRSGLDGEDEYGVIEHRVVAPGRTDVLGPGKRVVEPVAVFGAPLVAEAGSSGEFEDLVRRALGAISRNEMAKVVVARAIRLAPADGTILDIDGTLRSICNGDENSIGFAINQPGRGTFVGVTPEVLLRVCQGAVTTHAVAGTVGRGATSSQDRALGASLLSSAKDQHEHDLVVQGIGEMLQPICDELEFAPFPSLMTLDTVQHLSTAVRGQLSRGCNVLTAVACMHPTPALCGSPSSVAERWLENHEDLDRGWYAGPVGWLAPDGAGTFAVAIRSALLRGNEVHAFGGAGIVRGSVPSAEWRETEIKIAAVARHMVTRELES